MEFLRSANTIRSIKNSQQMRVGYRKPRLDVIETIVEHPDGDQAAIQAVAANAAFNRGLARHGKNVGIMTVRHAVDVSRVDRWLGECSKRSDIHGVMLCLPAAGIHAAEAKRKGERIKPGKDVDGRNPASHRLANGFLPPVALALHGLLKANGIDPAEAGKLVVCIGDDEVVMRALGGMHQSMGVTQRRVTSKANEELRRELLARADIVLAAGSAGLLKPDMLHEGQVVIGAGPFDIGRDVYSERCLRIQASAPQGGVGPLAAAFIHEHTLQSAIGNVQGGLSPLNLIQFGYEERVEFGGHLISA